ncbi:Os07g0519800 [Oryza sativa Japonica Group]|uniref:Os07g0519800 protein n=1 Tax=Oryza sativa subsp. japonica TaxID=39947 RepID=A0A0P0X6H2_ORYSJ|nr:Os07g0519800 [Oryza sativa Japonica Group]
MDAEHDEIAKSKQEGEALTREDVTRMKLSWRVAQESTRGHRGRRLRHPERVAGVLVAMRDAHGPGQVLAVPVRRPGGVGGATAAAALIVRGVRRRAEGMPRDGACEGGDAGDDALPCGSCAAACGEENTFVRDPLPTPLNGLPVELDRIAPLW